jgi:hypothetical protein
MENIITTILRLFHTHEAMLIDAKIAEESQLLRADGLAKLATVRQLDRNKLNTAFEEVGVV